MSSTSRDPGFPMLVLYLLSLAHRSVTPLQGPGGGCRQWSLDHLSMIEPEDEASRSTGPLCIKHRLWSYLGGGRRPLGIKSWPWSYTPWYKTRVVVTSGCRWSLFYYTSIRSLSFSAPFQYSFSISVALTLSSLHTTMHAACLILSQEEVTWAS